jgi:hypothetical protein
VNLSRSTLLHNLQDGGKTSDLRLAQEQMNMFRHNHVSSHAKQIFLAHVFEDLQKDIPRFGGIQKWKPVIATEGDEMEIVTAVISSESSWHDGFGPSFHRR